MLLHMYVPDWSISVNKMTRNVAVSIYSVCYFNDSVYCNLKVNGLNIYGSFMCIFCFGFYTIPKKEWNSGLILGFSRTFVNGDVQKVFSCFLT